MKSLEAPSSDHRAASDDPNGDNTVSVLATAQNHLIELLPKKARLRLLAICEPTELVMAQVLSDVDKLELRLQRSANDKQSGQVRSSDTDTVPAGYQDAVAEYFRRLSKRP